MSSYSRTVQWVVWGGLVLVILGISGAFVRSRMDGPPLPVYSQISDFTLTNQFGNATTFADMKGKVWMADIIFTRCPGPCASMTRRMQAFQQVLPKNSPLKLVSLTTDPEYDSPKILKEYGDKFGADQQRWTFLTGTKQQIHKLAVEGLKLVSLDKAEAERTSVDDLFIHSTIFVLVDGQGRLRATFEGDGDQAELQQKMLHAVKKVLNEKTP